MLYISRSPPLKLSTIETLHQKNRKENKKMANTKEATKRIDEYNKRQSKKSKKPSKGESQSAKNSSPTPSVKGSQIRESRKFSLVTYIHTEDLIRFLTNSPWIQHYAFAHHDLDKWTEADEKKNPEHKAGEDKKPHTHVILYTYNNKTSSAVRKNFDRFSKSCQYEKPESTKCEYCIDIPSMYRYLTHADDDDKHKYDNSVIVSDDPAYWVKHQHTDGMNAPENKGLSMVEDYLAHIGEREMILRYGKEWMYHRKYVMDSAHAIEYEELNKVPLTADLITAILRSGPFGELDIDMFFKMMKYIEADCHYKGTQADWTAYHEYIRNNNNTY